MLSLIWFHKHWQIFVIFPIKCVRPWRLLPDPCRKHEGGEAGWGWMCDRARGTRIGLVPNREKKTERSWRYLKTSPTTGDTPPAHDLLLQPLFTMRLDTSCFLLHRLGSIRRREGRDGVKVGRGGEGSDGDGVLTLMGLEHQVSRLGDGRNFHVDDLLMKEWKRLEVSQW